MRTAAATAVICLALIGVTHAKDANAAIRMPTHIESQSLGSALLQLAKQREIQVVYRSELVGARKTAGVMGDLTFEEALSQLLNGSGLTFEYLDSTAITIVPLKNAAPAVEAVAIPTPTPVAPSSVPAASATEPALWQKFKLAQVEAASSQPVEVAAVPAFGPTRDEKGIPEVLIKGAKVSLNADIQRTEDDVQPYVVYTAEEIQRSMATNLEDFFKSRLPMNTQSVTLGQDTRNGSNISEINLRGLGVDETLVLINGRRQPGVSNITQSDDENFGQPDINGIPLASIARIEVLPATAAGIYGGGATGGVINIVLKTNYTGLDVIANYANTFESESGIKRLSANGGTSFEGGRTNVALSLSYSEQNPMFVRSRDFMQRARALAIANNPEAYEDAFSQLPTGYTTNIRSSQQCGFTPDGGYECTMPNLTLKPQYGGTDLGSKITYVPVGYDGDPAKLVANAGRVNLAVANDLNNAGRSIQNNPRTNSVNLTVNRDFTDWLSMFVNVSRSENNGNVYFTGLQNSGYTVAADAPNNPFTTDISVSVPFPGYAFKQATTSESLNSVFGAAFSLPHRWRAQLEGNWGRSRSQNFGGAPFLLSDVQDPSSFGTILREGLSTGVKTGKIDVLQDLNQSPLNLSDYALEPYPNQTTSPSDSIGTGATLRVSGPVFQLPGGQITLSGSFEHRNSEAKATRSRILGSYDGQERYYYYPERETTTDSYYIETFVPLVSSQNAKPFVEALELQASTRRDDTSTKSVNTGGTPIDTPDGTPDSIEYTRAGVAATGYTFGFRYQPVRDVALRSSFSHGFLPPSITQISPKITTTDVQPAFYQDPLRNYEMIGTAATATIVGLGNPNLKPEESDSVSAGLIFTPRFLQAARLSVDYTEIRKSNEISNVDVFFLLQDPVNAEKLYPGRVVRGPSLGDGLPGPVTYLDGSEINIERTTVRAIDTQLDYQYAAGDLGSFDFYAVATMEKEYSRKVNAITPEQQSVGFHDGPLKWRGNAGITWHLGALSVGWAMQYYDSYLVYKVQDGPSSIDYVTGIQGSRSIESQSYHDVSFRYRLGEGLLSNVGAFSGTTISGGVQNVLNTSPPIEAYSADVGYSTYGDPRLRRYTLELSKSF